MLHYERVKTNLPHAKTTLKVALKSELGSETERTALEETLQLVQKAEKKCQMAQQGMFLPVVRM